MAETTNLKLPLLVGKDVVSRRNVNNLAQKVDEACLPVVHRESSGHWATWEAGKIHRQRDIIRTDDCPSWGFLECIKEGTTGAKAPTCPVNIDDTVVDGTAVWVLRKIGNGSIEDLTATKVVIDDTLTKLGVANVQAALEKVVTILQSVSDISANKVSFTDDNTPKIGNDVQTVLNYLINLSHPSNKIGDIFIDDGSKSDGFAITYDAATGTYKLSKVKQEINQVTKLGAIAPYQIDIPIQYTTTFAVGPVTVLKAGEDSGEGSKIITAYNFDNADADDFIIDGESGELSPYFEWDGAMSIKTNYSVDFADSNLGDTQIFVSGVVDHSIFKNIISVTLK